MADLSRFLNAQARDYETALREIRAGHKRSHWIWYIFPQLEGLGYSGTAQYYAIRGREEAEAYMEDPVLSHRGDGLPRRPEAQIQHDAVFYGQRRPRIQKGAGQVLRRGRVQLYERVPQVRK